MKRISASIDVCSSSCSLAELANIAGIEPQASSHDRGSPRGRRGIWLESILRIDSNAPDHLPLSDHIRDLLERVERVSMGARLAGRADVQVHLNVAVMFSTANASLEIDPDELLRLGGNRIGLDVTVYPTNQEPEKGPGGE